MSAEIYLVCNDGRSNKFYHIEVDRPSALTNGCIIKSYGRVGDNLKNERGGKLQFSYVEAGINERDIRSFIESKLKKGYEIREVKSPIVIPGVSSTDHESLSRITSNSSVDLQAANAASYLFDEGRAYRAGNELRAAAPAPKKIKPLIEDVQVTFDVGQTCPVW